MSETTPTPFGSKCDILGELWVSYKNDPEFQEFMEYNDLGLPLAYALSAEIITATPKAEMFVSETFELLLAALGRETDEGYETLADLLALE